MQTTRSILLNIFFVGISISETSTWKKWKNKIPVKIWKGSRIRTKENEVSGRVKVNSL